MKKQNKNNKLAFKKPSFLELTNKSMSMVVGGNRYNDRSYNHDDPHEDSTPEWIKQSWV